MIRIAACTLLIALAGCTDAPSGPFEPENAADAEPAERRTTHLASWSLDECRTLRMFLNADRTAVVDLLPEGYILHESTTPSTSARVTFHVHRCAMLGGLPADTTWAYAGVNVVPAEHRHNTEFPYDFYRFDTVVGDPALAGALAAHGISVASANITMERTALGHSYSIQGGGYDWQGELVTPFEGTEPDALGAAWDARWHSLEDRKAWFDVVEAQGTTLGLTPDYGLARHELSGGVVANMLREREPTFTDMTWSGSIAWRVHMAYAEPA